MDGLNPQADFEAVLREIVDRIVRRWIGKAEEDLAAAERLLSLDGARIRRSLLAVGLRRDTAAAA